MKWFKSNIKFLATAGICLVLAIALLNQCEHSAQLESDLETSERFREIEEDQSISRDSIYAHDIHEMEQNLMSEISARILLQEEFERFKDIQSHTRVETETRVDTLFIPYSPDSINLLALYDSLIPVDTVNKYFIQTPKKVNYSDTWFVFAGNVDSIGLTIDSLKMINKFDVTIGWKKPDKKFKMFRKKEPVVELISYNPYTEINYVNNVVIKGRQGSSLAEKVVTFGGGFISGYVVGQIKQ